MPDNNSSVRPSLDDLYGLSSLKPSSPSVPSRPSEPSDEYHLASSPQEPSQPSEPLEPSLSSSPVPSSYLEQFSQPSEPSSPSPPSLDQPPKLANFKKIVFLALAALVILLVLVFASRFLKNFSFFQNKEPTALTYWGLWEPDVIVQPLIDEFEGEHPGITVKYQKQNHLQYRERLQSALARDDGPDIFRFHSAWYPMFKENLVSAPGKIIKPADFAKEFYPVHVQDLIKNNQVIGVPLEIETLVLFYNKDLLDQFKASVPASWNELRATVQDITQKDSSGRIQTAGIALGTTSNVAHWQDIISLMFLQNGIDWSKVDSTILADGSNAGVDTLDYYVSFAQGSNRVWDETLPNSTLAFAGNKLVFYFGPSWEAFTFAQANPNLNFGLSPVPQLSPPGVNFASYWAEGVNAKADERKQEAAWEFLKFLSSKESLAKLYQGQSKIRLFGEPYPRLEMAQSLSADPLAGVVIAQAPTAVSWYLVSSTHDGDTGLNSRISKYFEDAVNSVLTGGRAQKALETVAAGISQTLTTYGVSP